MAKGSVVEAPPGSGRWRAFAVIGPELRRGFRVPTCTKREAALERGALLAELAAKLRAANVAPTIAQQLLERAASRDGKALAAVLEAVEAVCRGETVAKLARGKDATIKDVGVRWTSGELADTFPDHVKRTKDGPKAAQRLEGHVYPLVRDVRIADFTLDQAEQVMAALPKRLSRASRRHYAMSLHRVLSLAVFPLRIIAAHPLPRGFLPKLGPAKAKGWLYPEEDAKLMGAGPELVALSWRVFYGFLHREGPRRGEAVALDVGDVDLGRGILTLDKNKTDDPRAWTLSPGVASALSVWLEIRGSPPASSPLFVTEKGQRIEKGNDAKRYRAHLAAAGIDRPQLFERSDERMQVRLHETRATFCTLALASGKTESWVADRTGHRSSTMINKYRRAARTAAEADLGPLAPLDVAIPELAAVRGKRSKAPEKRSGPARAVANGHGAIAECQQKAPDRAPLTTGASDFESPNRGSNPCAGTDTYDVRPPARSDSRSAIQGGPRSVLVAALAEALGAATAAGDLEAARVAHRALGELLGADVDGAGVVNLASERARRGAT